MPFDDLDTPIGRAAVEHDVFEVRVLLLEDRQDGVLEPAPHQRASGRRAR